jgi:hypothetical protein
MSDTQFMDASGFLAWLAQPGSAVEFPYPGPGTKAGWKVRISGGPEQALEITSGFYAVRASEPYGAPKICGHRFPFGGSEASGVVTFGFDATDQLVVRNRRRLTAADTLAEGLVLVTVTNACAPDRVDEPVAVVAHAEDRVRIKLLTAEQRIAVFARCRDGVELVAARAVFTWADEMPAI